MGPTAVRLTWAAIGLIVALLVGGLLYSAAKTKATSVAGQIAATTSCSASTCTN